MMKGIDLIPERYETASLQKEIDNALFYLKFKRIIKVLYFLLVPIVLLGMCSFVPTALFTLYPPTTLATLLYMLGNLGIQLALLSLWFFDWLLIVIAHQIGYNKDKELGIY